MNSARQSTKNYQSTSSLNSLFLFKMSIYQLLNMLENRIYIDISWVQRNCGIMFDFSMGIYDGAEVHELIGLFILSTL